MSTQSVSVQTVNVCQAIALLKAHRDGYGGQVFSAEFTKRSTGERRVVNGRFNVVKHLAGGELKYDPAEKGLMSYYDNIAKGYRMLNLHELHWIQIAGVKYEVV